MRSTASKTFTESTHKPRALLVFIATIILGFACFIFPNLFFGITKLNGGLKGVNLVYVALFQFVTIIVLLYYSLRKLGRSFRDIGLSLKYWGKDLPLGLFFGLCWALIQFCWLIPATGGADRADIQLMLEMMDGGVTSTVSYLILGVLGGGVTEEIFNRGYFITVLQSVFKNRRIGVWIASILSILFFSIGHLPTNGVEWMDILIPSVIYTLLFLKTKRLTAPIAAHAVYNLTAILLTHILYLH